MPGTIVNPKKDLIYMNSNNILFWLRYRFSSISWMSTKSAFDHNNCTFCISIFFHWVTIVPILHLKANKQLTFIILFTNKFSLKHFLGLETLSVIYGFIERDNKSLDGTPLGQPSGRDAPSFSILKVTQCPTKT